MEDLGVLLENLDFHHRKAQYNSKEINLNNSIHIFTYLLFRVITLRLVHFHWSTEQCKGS